MSHPRIGIRLLRKPKACMIALRKTRRKWRRRRERPERVCKKRSLLCPLSERRRRHPRLFAVLDFLVLLGQAKSTKKNSCRLSVCAKAGQLVSQASPASFSCSFFRRKSQRRPRGENRREAAAHLAERSRKTALFCTIVPGVRYAAASLPDIFTSRKQAGLRPAENK